METISAIRGPKGMARRPVNFNVIWLWSLGADSMTVSQRELKIDAAFVVRFVAFGAIMSFVNIVPYLLTRGAYGTDGIEIAGWPLRCYGVGGFDGHWHFYPWAMAGNTTVAVIVSGFAAWVFRDGIRKTLRKWQTWGTLYSK